MHWGNKVMLGFVAFAAMIGYLVFQSFRTRFDLVEPDYYRNELRYQEVIDGSRRAAAIADSVQLSAEGKQVVLQLPAGKPVSGEIWFYCAQDARLDKKFPLNPDSEGRQVFSGIPAGIRFTAKLRWQQEEETYVVEKTLYLAP
ncbi:FixH family protein [Flavihumibacter petaseus]|uniref:FixH protein n=1 Tax=Flavihumibacter petaseus NBRC 106054 TaxID=1220578 RepID=A0A0E9N5C5_9BACT|nr:FixH family protein [Flavihumibacter petaseus]GAO45172.1 hypothetical protein FPE01S_04_04160 [Flavihumibacter petaseus NBRC 106054]